MSVIVPAYNAGRFIKRALEGIREQCHTNWEIIVIEDGSNDETEGVVSEFAPTVVQRVTYAKNEGNFGVSTTRNRAMSQARGEIIAFLDADDWWTSEHLAAGQNTLRAGADLCFSGFQFYHEAENKVGKTFEPTAAQLRSPINSLFRQNFIQTSSIVMLWRVVAEKIDGFDTGLRVGEDLDYWLRLLGAGHVLRWTGKNTCHYAKHSESAMAKTLMVSEDSVALLRKHLKSEYLPLSLRKRLLADSLVSHGRLLWKRDCARARVLLAEAWKYQPFNLRCLAYAVAGSMVAKNPMKRASL